MRRPASAVREGDRMLTDGAPASVVAVRRVAVGAVRIITASGDAYEYAPTEPVDLAAA